MKPANKLPAYRMTFEAMSSEQLARVARELLALAPRYLGNNPGAAEALYAAAGLAVGVLCERAD